MKIKIPTKSASALKKKIFDAVEDETLKTWVLRRSQEGYIYLTHKPEQWYDKAILSFITTDNALEIHVTHWTGIQQDLAVDGYYLGRFIEVLLVHFSADYQYFEVFR